MAYTSGMPGLARRRRPGPRTSRPALPVASARAALPTLRVVNAAELFDGLVAIVRQVTQEVERLDTDGVAGLVARGLGTPHLFGHRLPASARWPQLSEHAEDLARGSWRDVLAGLGYTLEELPRRGHLARAGGRLALVVHPQRSADHFARLDEEGRLPEGALLAACEAHGARYGLLAAGTRMRLLRAAGEEGGAATRYLELDAAALEPSDRPLLGLLSPDYLVDGDLDELLAEARDPLRSCAS
ncbi:MAG: hypothetical protein ACR2GL_03240 [Thermoleophilaceae bacterium]